MSALRQENGNNKIEMRQVLQKGSKIMWKFIRLTVAVILMFLGITLLISKQVAESTNCFALVAAYIAINIYIDER